MGRKSAYIFFIALSAATVCRAFVYESMVLRSWDKESGRYRYFVGLSDFHDNANRINGEQLAVLQSLLTAVPQEKLVVGLEDITSAGMTTSNIEKEFCIKAEGSFLAGCAQACRALRLPTNNFEYRYYRVASVGPALNNLQAPVHTFESTRKISVALLVREIEDVCSQIQAYQDGHVLREFYGICVNDVKKQMQELGLYEHSNKSVADYLETVARSEQRLALMKKLLTFDSVLLDVRMLHSILTENKRSIYMICAGGSHTARVAQLLIKCGYEHVHTTQSNSIREYNLEKCLGSNIIDGAYCQKPTPIDLHGIERFLRP